MSGIRFAETLALTMAKVRQRPRHPRLAACLRLAVLGIEAEEAHFDRRGFAPAPSASGSSSRSPAPAGGPRERLEQVGRTFVLGYRAAIKDDSAPGLAGALAGVDPELSGFAWEGAAMGVALRDALAPWRQSRLRELLAGPGEPHRYMVHVGAGWALARMRRRPRAIRSLDPLLRWLALDGYGFHEGYFHPARAIRGGARPHGFSGYAARALDQGLGRSLWFVECAHPEAIRRSVEAFGAARRPDLWSGVALAATYAGGADADTLASLAPAAEHHRAHVAQGAAFAAAAREHAGNPAAHTELACRLLTGLSARDAARFTDAAAESLPADAAEPAYEVWRRRLRAALADAALGGTPWPRRA